MATGNPYRVARNRSTSAARGAAWRCPASQIDQLVPRSGSSKWIWIPRTTLDDYDRMLIGHGLQKEGYDIKPDYQWMDRHGTHDGFSERAIADAIRNGPRRAHQPAIGPSAPGAVASTARPWIRRPKDP